VDVHDDLDLLAGGERLVPEQLIVFAHVVGHCAVDVRVVIDRRGSAHHLCRSLRIGCLREIDLLPRDLDHRLDHRRLVSGRRRLMSVRATA
jgi:hypothetical protein